MIEITISEAVDLTGYSRQQIYNLIKENKVRSKLKKLNGTSLRLHFIEKNSLLDYIDSRAARRAEQSNGTR